MVNPGLTIKLFDFQEQAVLELKHLYPLYLLIIDSLII